MAMATVMAMAIAMAKGNCGSNGRQLRQRQRQWMMATATAMAGSNGNGKGNGNKDSNGDHMVTSTEKATMTLLSRQLTHWRVASSCDGNVQGMGNALPPPPAHKGVCIAQNCAMGV